jgi:ribosomal protein S18 acetylase RimI-like enzyme
MALTWRPMQVADLAAVVALADRLHPHYPESPAVYAERLALAPDGCHVLADGTALFGYAVAHPWTGLAPPPLDSLLGALPPGPWHLHDIALAPPAQGAGHAAALLRQWPQATLVAIPGTSGYWERQGFRDAPCTDPAALASYGKGARFMAR